MVGGGGRQEGWCLEGGDQTVVDQSGPGGPTVLASLWDQRPRLRCLESPSPPALHGPLVLVWPLSPGQSGALSLVQIPPDTLLSLVQIPPDTVF